MVAFINARSASIFLLSHDARIATCAPTYFARKVGIYRRSCRQYYYSPAGIDSRAGTLHAADCHRKIHALGIFILQLHIRAMPTSRSLFTLRKLASLGRRSHARADTGLTLISI